MKSPLSPSLKARALRMLALREHSRKELLSKLQPHAQSPQALAELLDEFELKGWLSDERFVAATMNRLSSKWGGRKVIQLLKEKGIDAETLVQAQSTLGQTELDRARLVWLKKFGDLPESPIEKAKQIRFLVSRGFDFSVIQKVLKVDEPSEG